MAGEIKVGSKFGSYDATVKQMEAKNKSERRSNMASEHYDFFDYSTGAKKAEADRSNDKVYTGKIVNGKPEEKWCNSASVTMGSYYFSASTTTATPQDANKFTRIDTAGQYAIDKNHNGVVDEGEVFNKKLDSST